MSFGELRALLHDSRLTAQARAWRSAEMLARMNDADREAARIYACDMLECPQRSTIHELRMEGARRALPLLSQEWEARTQALYEAFATYPRPFQRPVERDARWVQSETTQAVLHSPLRTLPFHRLTSFFEGVYEVPTGPGWPGDTDYRVVRHFAPRLLEALAGQAYVNAFTIVTRLDAVGRAGAWRPGEREAVLSWCRAWWALQLTRTTLQEIDGAALGHAFQGIMSAPGTHQEDGYIGHEVWRAWTPESLTRPTHVYALVAYLQSEPDHFWGSTPKPRRAWLEQWIQAQTVAVETLQSSGELGKGDAERLWETVEWMSCMGQGRAGS